MKRKVLMEITYDATKTTPSKIIHILGNRDEIIKSKVFEG